LKLCANFESLKLAEHLVGEYSGSMTIGPNGLDAIRSHSAEAHELKRGWGERLVGSFVKMAHHVRFSFASRAGASETKRLEAHDGFFEICPTDGEMITDDLNISGLHRQALAERE
jgi:hypothetical protein